MKPNERNLLAAVLAGETPRAAGERLGVHRNRVHALCLKWSQKGWYDYGVCADLGWLTDVGRARAAEVPQ